MVELGEANKERERRERDVFILGTGSNGADFQESNAVTMFTVHENIDGGPADMSSPLRY